MSNLPKHVHPAYAKDIRTLLVKYTERNDASFAVFKEEWKKLKFAMIHRGKPEDASGHVYLQELYTTCVGYLSLDGEESARDGETTRHHDPMLLKVAVVYTLYALYKTQMVKPPKEQINITPEVYEELMKMREMALQKKLHVDVHHVLLELRRLNAFRFCAMVNVDPLLSSLHTPEQHSQQIEPLPNEIEQRNTLRDAIKVADIETFTNRYHEMKEQVLRRLDPSHGGIVRNAMNIARRTFDFEIDTAISQHQMMQSQRKSAFIEEAMAYLRNEEQRPQKSRGATDKATARTRRQRIKNRHVNLLEKIKDFLPGGNANSSASRNGISTSRNSRTRRSTMAASSFSQQDTQEDEGMQDSQDMLTQQHSVTSSQDSNSLVLDQEQLQYLVNLNEEQEAEKAGLGEIMEERDEDTEDESDVKPPKSKSKSTTKKKKRTRTSHAAENGSRRTSKRLRTDHIEEVIDAFIDGGIPQGPPPPPPPSDSDEEYDMNMGEDEMVEMANDMQKGAEPAARSKKGKGSATRSKKGNESATRSKKGKAKSKKQAKPVASEANDKEGSTSKADSSTRSMNAKERLTEEQYQMAVLMGDTLPRNTYANSS